MKQCFATAPRPGFRTKWTDRLFLVAFVSIAVFVLHNVNIENLDIFLWLLFVGSGVFDFLDYIESLCRTTKYSMLAVKPGLEHKFG